MSKYTPWFPGTVKPVHVGVYQRQYNSPPVLFYCYWNGRAWGFPENRAKDAAGSDSLGASLYQKLPWRGLAEKPA